jgi:Tfp pilus assembly protein PilF
MTLNLNLSICHCNKKPSAPLDGVKCAKEAINLDANSCKAHYRLAHSYKLLNDFENAKASMKEAVLLEPNNL